MASNEEDIWRGVIGQASLNLEVICQEKQTTNSDVDNGKTTQDYGKEQYLTVNVKVQMPQINSVPVEKTHLVLVVDNSGSMAGKPWKQVQESVKGIINQVLELSFVKLDLIVYNSTASVVQFSQTSYKDTIDSIKSQGMTDFKLAFKKLVTVVKEAGSMFTRTVVMFMTDGHDTANTNVISFIPTLSEELTALDKNICIHTVGFSTSHNFDFLKKLSEEGGTSPGMFRFAEPGTDTQSLQLKLDELFDFLLFSARQSVSLQLSIPDDKGQFIDGKNKTSNITLATTLMGDTEEKQVVSETWISVEDIQQLPEFQVTLETNISEESGLRSVTIPCVYEKVNVKVIESANEKTAWRLRILNRNVDDLASQIGAAIDEKSDVSNLQQRLEKYQQQVSRTAVYGNGITKEMREVFFKSIQEIQNTLQLEQAMLAEYVRTGTGSISLLARAHDMRYQAVFSKSRRQRVMDKRVGKNMKLAQEDQDNLTKLEVDEQEVKNLSHDALQFYFCVLSQDSVKDVLLGGDNADTIGFGLAVKRTEVVLDEPTLIRIQVISGTLVSRNAMLDALEHKINVSSHLKAHGGFSFEDTPLGVTTIGAGREPINAWLPLYITRSHWDRVKAILRPALGSFCTLDPLGYHYKQLDVLFTVLGSMIGQLQEKQVGQHQLQLLFAVQRTCTACMVDFNLVDNVCETVQNFVDSPAGRTKDIIPNLYTLIGYIAAMPTEKAKEVFKIGDEKTNLSGFWVGYISEVVRRTVGVLYHDSSLTIINGILSVLVRGNVTQDASDIVSPCEAVSQLIQMCCDPNIGDLDINIQPFDPASEVKVPEPVLKHDPKVDEEMEIWAQEKTGYLKNLSEKKKYKNASSIVKQWMKDVGTVSDVNPDRAEDSSIPSDKVTAADIECVTSHMLQVMAKLNHKVCKAAYPGIRALPGCIAFVNNWLSRQHDICDLDTNSGLPPQSWIEEVKNDVMAVYKEIREFENDAACNNSSETCVEINKSEIKETSISNETPSQETSLSIETTNQTSEQNINDTTGVANQNVEHEIVTNQITEPQVRIDINEGQESRESCASCSIPEPEKDIGGSGNSVNNNDNFDIEDYDSYDDEYDEDDDDNDDYDSYTTRSRREHQKMSKTQNKDQISLVSILHYLEKDTSVILSLRAILCQAVRFPTNSSARSAISKNILLDLKDGHEVRLTTLCKFREYLQEHQENILKDLQERVMWKQANHCMLHATTTWAFVGYLMNTHKSRLEGFSELVDLFLNTSEQAGAITLPCLQDKVHILLTGKYMDLPVLDNGNQWLPEKKMATKFKTLLGEEIWMDFEVELRSSVQIHVYRESDIPNRHSHCNSNPYIPNCLREKLGMKLLPIAPSGRRRKFNRKH